MSHKAMHDHDDAEQVHRVDEADAAVDSAFLQAARLAALLNAGAVPVVVAFMGATWGRIPYYDVALFPMILFIVGIGMTALVMRNELQIQVTRAIVEWTRYEATLENLEPEKPKQQKPERPIVVWIRTVSRLPRHVVQGAWALVIAVACLLFPLLKIPEVEWTQESMRRIWALQKSLLRKAYRAFFVGILLSLCLMVVASFSTTAGPRVHVPSLVQRILDLRHADGPVAPLLRTACAEDLDAVTEAHLEVTFLDGAVFVAAGPKFENFRGARFDRDGLRRLFDWWQFQTVLEQVSAAAAREGCAPALRVYAGPSVTDEDLRVSLERLHDTFFLLAGNPRAAAVLHALPVMPPEPGRKPVPRRPPLPVGARRRTSSG